ncbi:uncharacterized protein PG986_004210 [Apiospora aurea]|uniref:Uncharacterized protein n=1 Tax=Apiospora aurea TaxID=335848 RepID=A0ABR1QLY1_9PEZI
MGYITPHGQLSLVAASPQSLRVLGCRRRALVERVLTAWWARFWAGPGFAIPKDMSEKRIIILRSAYSYSYFYNLGPTRSRYTSCRDITNAGSQS